MSHHMHTMTDKKKLLKKKQKKKKTKAQKKAVDDVDGSAAGGNGGGEATLPDGAEGSPEYQRTVARFHALRQHAYHSVAHYQYELGKRQLYCRVERHLSTLHRSMFHRSVAFSLQERIVDSPPGPVGGCGPDKFFGGGSPVWSHTGLLHAWEGHHQ